MRNQTFTNRFLQRNIIMILLCSLLLVLFVFLQNIKINHLNRQNANAQYLSNYQNSMDTSISFTTNTIWQITQDPDFREYCMTETDSINYYMLSLQDALNVKLSSFDNYCYTISVIKEGYPVVLTDRFSSSLQNYLADIEISQEQYQKTLSTLKEKENGVYSFVPNGGDTHSPYITLAARYRFSHCPAVYIFISLYREYFTPLFQSSDSFYLLADEQIIAGSPALTEPETKKLLSDVSELYQKQKTQQELYRDSKNGITYLAAPSNVLNCNYVMLTRTSPGETILKFILILMMAATAAGIIILLLKTRTLTKPITQIAKTLQPFYKNNEKNELSFISEATTAIIQKNAALSEHLTNKNNDLKNHFLVELLLGILSEEECAAYIAEFGLEELSTPTVIAIIDFYNYEPSGSTSLTADYFKEYICAYTQKNNGEDILKEIVPFKTKYVLLLCQIPQATLINLLEKLLRDCGKKLSSAMVASIGPIAETPKDLKNSFNVALNLLEYKYAMNTKNVLTQNSLRTLDNDILYYPLDIEHMLINYTISANRTKAHLILDEIFEKNLIKVSAQSDLFSEFVQSIVSTIKRCLQLTDLTIDDVYEEGAILYLELKMCTTKEELQKKTLAFFDTLIGCFETAAAKRSELTLESFTAYIEENYNRDLSLEEVAEHFQYSIPYTSKTVKTLTGTNFKKYLNQYRINVAKTLLTQDAELKIKELAQQVGFSNSNSFIRTFKATVGLSPGEYRERGFK